MLHFKLYFRGILHAVLLVLVLGGAGMAVGSCTQTIGPTSILAKDSVRHYYPLIQRDELRMTWEITNMGPEPLIITDILPAVSAITLESAFPEIIPVGETEKLNFIYRSDMNIGYVEHKIRLYGNILPEGVCELTFDTHIVRPTVDGSDWEEIFSDQQRAEKDLVDGEQGEKGYWVGDGTAEEDFSRNYMDPVHDR